MAFGKHGHIVKVCWSKKPTGTPPQQTGSAHRVEDTNSSKEYTLYHVSVHYHNAVTPLKSTILGEGKPLCMEVNTGASVSVFNQETFKKLWPRDTARIVHPSTVKLRTLKSWVPSW